MLVLNFIKGIKKYISKCKIIAKSPSSCVRLTRKLSSPIQLSTWRWIWLNCLFHN